MTANFRWYQIRTSLFTAKSLQAKLFYRKRSFEHTAYSGWTTFAIVLVTVHKKLLKGMDTSGKLANIFICLLFLRVLLGCSPTQDASDHQDIRISVISGSTRKHMTYSLVDPYM